MIHCVASCVARGAAQLVEQRCRASAKQRRSASAAANGRRPHMIGRPSMIGDASSIENTSAPLPEIEFWFDFGSNYSYLSVMRIDSRAESHGVRILWRPFLLGPVFRDLGFDDSPFVLQKKKGAYVWKDMERQCRKYGLALTRPTVFPRAALLAIRVALLGADQPWMASYCRKIMQLNFVDDRDIGSADVVKEALDDLGLPAQQIIADAQ